MSSSIKPDVVDYGGLALNLETYQASIDGRPLDLTYIFVDSGPSLVKSRRT
jgi:hypothetical protein